MAQTPQTGTQKTDAALELDDLREEVRRLRQSQARYRDFIARASAGIWCIEFRPPIDVEAPVAEQMARFLEDGYYTECNDAGARIAGFERGDQVVGARCGTIMPPGDERNLAVIRQIVEAGYSMAEGQFRKVDHKGRLVDTVTSFEGLITDGKLERMWGTSLDITSQNQVFTAWREAQYRFDRLTQASYEGIAITLGTTIVEVSARLARMLGYTPEEMVGRPVVDFVAPESRDLVLAEMEKGEPEAVRHDALTKDGTKVPVEWSGKEFTMAGQRHLVSALCDLSDRVKTEAALRQSERRYRAVVDTQTEFISRSLPDTTLTFVNHAYCRYFGVTPGEVVGTSFLDLVDPEYRDSIREYFASLVRSPRISAHVHEVLRPDGSTAWNEWVDVPIQDAEGVVTEFQSVGRDITERVQSREKLRAAAGRLETLRALDREILAAENWRKVASVAVEYLGRIIPDARVALYVHDEEKRDVELVASVSDDDWEGDMAQLRDPQVDELDVFDPFFHGQAEVSDLTDLGESSSYFRTLSDQGARSGFGVPLLAHGKLFGALSLVSRTPKGFSEEQMEIAREVGASLSIALQQGRLFEEINAANARLQSLSKQLVDAQEAERRHLAHELHDQIGQMLTAAQMGLAHARNAAGEAEQAIFDEQIELLGETIGQVRNMSLDLRPSVLDEEGLAPALRWLLRRQAGKSDLKTELAFGDLPERLSPLLEITCYRVVQEAMTNVLRHADATTVSVELDMVGGELILKVQDDGAGFDTGAAQSRGVSGQSIGLLGMSERVRLAGGKIRVDSERGAGTSIVAVFPLD